MNQDLPFRFVTLIVSVALILFSTALSADTWTEQNDAGSLQGSAQVPTGNGALVSIDGAISSFNDADVYKIYLTGGKTFSASTHPSDGGNATFDTMLFLFDADGLGVYYDDDIDDTFLAQLPANHALTPKSPGIYYLIVTAWENDPISAGGQIFENDDDDFHVFGPTLAGAGSPWSSYDNGGEESGTYHIALTGAEFVEIQQPHAVEPAMSASWYYAYESGHGIMIHLLSAEQAWMCWFTFDLDGNRAWICALGTVDGGVITFADAFTVEGGQFPPLFDASQIAEVPWGSITVTFTGCDDGRMEWTTSEPGFQSGSMPLTRLTSLWGNDCQ